MLRPGRVRFKRPKNEIRHILASHLNVFGQAVRLFKSEGDCRVVKIGKMAGLLAAVSLDHPQLFTIE